MAKLKRIGPSLIQARLTQPSLHLSYIIIVKLPSFAKQNLKRVKQTVRLLEEPNNDILNSGFAKLSLNCQHDEDATKQNLHQTKIPCSRVCVRQTLRSAPIAMSGNLSVNVSAESPSNISPNYILRTHIQSRVSGIFNRFEISFGNLSRTFYIPEEKKFCLQTY